jgi:hypothetical protein
VPVGIAARPYGLRSWDRFMVPWPFARIGVVSAPPLAIERDVSEARLASSPRSTATWRPPSAQQASWSRERAAPFVGPAKCSYDDWEGIVYPKGSGLDRLEAVARLFDLVEINTTFYGPLQPRTAEEWLERIGASARFRFTAKLVKRFTHDDPGTWTLADRDAFRAGLAPLRFSAP